MAAISHLSLAADATVAAAGPVSWLSTHRKLCTGRKQGENVGVKRWIKSAAPAIVGPEHHIVVLAGTVAPSGAAARAIALLVLSKWVSDMPKVSTP